MLVSVYIMMLTTRGCVEYRSPSRSSVTPVKSSTSVSGGVSSTHDSVHSPVPASPAEQSSAMEPDDNEDDDDNDGDGELSAVPQVMVGPDGNIVLNPGRSDTVSCRNAVSCVLSLCFIPSLC